MGIIKSQIDISEQMRLVIEQGLKKELEIVFEEAKKQALEKFESTKGQLVAGFLVKMMRTVEMQMMGDRITFTIENKAIPKE